MAAILVFASLLRSLSGGEPDQQGNESITETPAVQKRYVELKFVQPTVVEPVVVETGEIATDAALETVENPVIDPKTETREPIGTDVELLDQIEPMFEDEVEAATAVEPPDAVPSVIVEDAQIADAAPTIADPQPAAVEQNVGNQNIPIAEPIPEPVAEPVEIVEPDIVAEAETVSGTEQEAIERDADPLDAIMPMIIVKDTETFPDPQPEVVEGSVSEPAAAIAAPVTETSQFVEPYFVGEFESLTDAEPGTVEEPVSSPKAEASEPDAQPIEALDPAIVEDASGWFADSAS